MNAVSLLLIQLPILASAIPRLLSAAKVIPKIQICFFLNVCSVLAGTSMLLAISVIYHSHFPLLCITAASLLPSSGTVALICSFSAHFFPSAKRILRLSGHYLAHLCPKAPHLKSFFFLPFTLSLFQPLFLSQKTGNVSSSP